MSEKFTALDIASTLKVTLRTAHRLIEKLISKEKGKIYIEQDVFDLIIARQGLDTTKTDSDSDIITNSFTPEEYAEFQKRLIEYPLIKKHLESLREDIDYHKKQYHQLLEMHKAVLANMTQRNWIEAKEKGLEG
jgi:hypothetical protein